jgi:glycosyltransferase involved in cell wall biosynthesis
VLDDPELRARLRRIGPHRAARFSWDRAARETVAAFRALRVPLPDGRPLSVREKETVTS